MEKEAILIISLAVIWTLPWKGIALWRAATHRDKVWFIVLLLINTLSILEILYIFIFSRKKIPLNSFSTAPKKII